MNTTNEISRHDGPSSMERTWGSIERWWDGRSKGAKIAIGIVGGVVVLATGGAVAYAIFTGGVVVASGSTMVAVGAAATTLAARAG